MAGNPREVADHFMDLHSTRIIGEDTRNRHHSPRKDYLQQSSSELKIEEVVTYLERVRDRAERSAPPSRRTQETQTVPAALLPATTTFLLQELPSTPTVQQHLHQVLNFWLPSTSLVPFSHFQSSNSSHWRQSFISMHQHLQCLFTFVSLKFFLSRNIISRHFCDSHKH